MQATDVRPAPYPRGASILVPIVLIGSAFLLPWSGSGNLDPGVSPSWSNYFVQGILLLGGGLAGLRTLYLVASASRQRRLARNHPSQPWLWRKDWQVAGIGNTSMQHMLQTLMFAAGIAVMAVAVDWWVLAAVFACAGELFGSSSCNDTCAAAGIAASTTSSCAPILVVVRTGASKHVCTQSC